MLLRPLLLDMSLTDAEVCFTVQHGPRPLKLKAAAPVLVGNLSEVGPEVHVDILSLNRQPLYGFSIDRSTADGSALLIRLCSELVQA